MLCCRHGSMQKTAVVFIGAHPRPSCDVYVYQVITIHGNKDEHIHAKDLHAVAKTMGQRYLLDEWARTTSNHPPEYHPHHPSAVSALTTLASHILHVALPAAQLGIIPALSPKQYVQLAFLLNIIKTVQIKGLQRRVQSSNFGPRLNLDKYCTRVWRQG